MSIKIKWIIVFAIIAFTYSIFFLFDSETTFKLVKEDGIIEYTGALLWLFASICFFKIFYIFILNKKSRSAFFMFSLAILMFFAFGEEISWGQRIFGVETPEFMKENNIQGELNLHNLEIFSSRKVDGEMKSGLLSEWLTVSRMFQVFWFSFAVIIPILSYFSKNISRIIIKIGIPIIPLWIGSIFVINYIMQRILTFLTPNYLLAEYDPKALRFVEIKESLFAFLFLIVALNIYSSYKLSLKKVEKKEI